MKTALITGEVASPPRTIGGAGDEVLSWLGGIAFTFGLLWSMAHFENRTAPAPKADFEDLRAAALPLAIPPPPATVQQPEPVDSVNPLVGLEVGASDSPVKITVLPPDFDSLLPTVQVAPPATIHTLQLFSSLKPRIDVAGDFDRIFQQSEVDRIPTVLYRPDPKIPSRVRRDADVLRVSLLLVVDTAGVVINVRVLRASGNPEFDAIIVQSVKEEWSFSPAIKKGKKVRCLLQQAVAVKWTAGSKFML